MKEVSFLERLAEKLLEEGLVQLLKPKLQPVQIAKALAREMDRSRIVGPDTPLVANQYVVHLHPDDLAAFERFRASLERELAAYLAGYASRRGFKPIAAPSVRLLPADPPAKTGSLRVESSMVDPEPAAGGDRDGVPDGWQATAEMQAVLVQEGGRRQEPPPTEGVPRAFILDESGRPVELVRTPTAIGRAMDNDIILEGRDISRHHARILWESGRHVLQDLDSTNGSFVRGERVSRQFLTDGDELAFGALRFVFHLGKS